MIPCDNSSLEIGVITIKVASIVILIGNQAYITIYATLILSQSQLLLTKTNIAKKTTTNSAPPNPRGWNSFNHVGILTNAIHASRKNISISARFLTLL